MGVDFGTTTCSAGICDQDGAKLVLDRGEAAIPSTVFFPDRGEPLLGGEAVVRQGAHPASTVRSVKRMLGRDPADPVTQRHARTLHYPIREGPGNSIVLGLSSGDVTCEQVVATALRQLSTLAEKRFACRVRQMVATIPASASRDYEKALHRAAALAHLKIVETLPEPVAGALPMRLHLADRERTLVVCDFGGGTFDATLIDAGLRRLDVVACAGDDYLGGEDFDEKLLEAIAGEVFKRSSFDLLRDAVLKHRLLLRCEEAKRALSSHPEVRLRMADAYRHNGQTQPIDATVERSWVEPHWEPLVARAVAVVEQLLRQCGREPAEVDEVALIGGTSMVPLFRRRLEALFDPGKILPNVGAATAVVEGAVLRAGALERQVPKRRAAKYAGRAR